MTAHGAAPIAIIDTNVLLEIYSCHDHYRAHAKAYAEHGDEFYYQLDPTHRGQRARASLLLAIYLNDIAATTYGSHGEFLDIITKTVPPSPAGTPGGQNWEEDFLTQALYVVGDRVLTNWTHTVPSLAEAQRGSRNDQWLVDEAARLNVPLITHEGLSKTGDRVVSGIDKKAAVAGVQVLMPREFFNGKLDERERSKAFLNQLGEEIEKLTVGRTDDLGKILAMVQDHYGHVLN
jgi:hypothetical protein